MKKSWRGGVTVHPSPSLDCVTMDIVAFFFLSVGAEIWEFFNSLIEFRMM